MNDISWYTRISSIYAGQYIKATPMRQSLLNWTSCLVIHMVNIYINKAIKPLPSSSFALSNNWGVGLIQGLALTSRLWNVPMQFFYFSSTRLAGHRPPVITKEFNLTVNSEQAAHVECRFSNVFVVPVLTGEWAQVVEPVTDQCPPYNGVLWKEKLESQARNGKLVEDCVNLRTWITQLLKISFYIGHAIISKRLRESKNCAGAVPGPHRHLGVTWRRFCETDPDWLRIETGGTPDQWEEASLKISTMASGLLLPASFLRQVHIVFRPYDTTCGSQWVILTSWGNWSVALILWSDLEHNEPHFHC